MPPKLFSESEIQAVAEVRGPVMYLACHAAEAGLIDEAQKAAAKLLELKPDFTLELFETKLSAHIHSDVVQRNMKKLSRLDLPK